LLTIFSLNLHDGLLQLARFFLKLLNRFIVLVRGAFVVVRLLQIIFSTKKELNFQQQKSSKKHAKINPNGSGRPLNRHERKRKMFL
jgi:hypothetical protein